MGEAPIFGGDVIIQHATNNLSTEKETISGYVIDDPIQNATIELQDINGTLIQIFEG